MKSAKKAVKKAAVARKKAAAKKAGRVVRKGAARPKVAAVAAANGDAKVDARSALREEYTIEAKNFGPIAEAKLTLKPLTVLIGPSNMGKTYMATIAYMMTNKHTQFIQAARRAMFLTPYEAVLKKIGHRELRGIATGMVSAIEKGGNSVSLSDLPDKLQTPWRVIAGRMFEKVVWGDAIDLGPYFAVGENIKRLIGGDGNEAICKYTVRASNGAETARARIKFHESGNLRPSAKLSEFHFPMVGAAISPSVSQMKKALDSDSKFRTDGVAGIEEIIDTMFRGDASGAAANLSAHFLPASRHGLLQEPPAITSIIETTPSRVIADYLREFNTLLWRLSGLRDMPTTPSDLRKRGNLIRRLGISRVSDLARFRVRLRDADLAIKTVTKKIEEFLGGEVTVKSSDTNAPSAMKPPPTLVYRPAEAKGKFELEMTRASSMVGEIAPLVLYLKGGIEPGDTLFIEEPEAHLHPSAQTQITEILAAMVHAGIRVVITTHSDWMLPSIANIVRRGELGEESEEVALTKEEVGVWLFERGKKGGSTTRELKFDAPPGSGDRGYIPDNLRDLSNNLHNETADLLDAMDEAAVAAAK